MGIRKEKVTIRGGKSITYTIEKKNIIFFFVCMIFRISRKNCVCVLVCENMKKNEAVISQF